MSILDITLAFAFKSLDIQLAWAASYHRRDRCLLWGLRSFLLDHLRNSGLGSFLSSLTLFLVGFLVAPCFFGAVSLSCSSPAPTYNNYCHLLPRNGPSLRCCITGVEALLLDSRLNCSGLVFLLEFTLIFGFAS